MARNSLSVVGRRTYRQRGWRKESKWRRRDKTSRIQSKEVEGGMSEDVKE